MKDSGDRLSLFTIVLHWTVALVVIFLASTGLYMVENEAWDLYPIHKSIGVLIFAVILVRVAWRLYNGLPKPVGNYAKYQHFLAVVTHWTLLIATVIMPISGMMYSGFSGHGFGIFDLVLVETNHDPNVEWGVIPYNETLSSVGQRVHSAAGYILIAALALHLIGALKHHIMDKDRTLVRMLGVK